MACHRCPQFKYYITCFSQEVAIPWHFTLKWNLFTIIINILFSSENFVHLFISKSWSLGQGMNKLKKQRHWMTRGYLESKQKSRKREQSLPITTCALSPDLFYWVTMCGRSTAQFNGFITRHCTGKQKIWIQDIIIIMVLLINLIPLSISVFFFSEVIKKGSDKNHSLNVWQMG